MRRVGIYHWFERAFEELLMWTVFNKDLWGPVWPNLAASGVSLPVAFIWHHRRIKAHVATAIEEAKRQ